MLYEPLIVRDIPYRVYIGKTESFREHWHSEMELLICKTGGLEVCMEHRSVWLNAGDAVLIPGYEAHAIGKTLEDTTRIAVVFGYGLLGNGYHTVRDRSLVIPAAQETQTQLYQAVDAVCAGALSKREWKLRSGLFLLADHLQQRTEQTDSVQNVQKRVRRLEGIYPVLEYVKKNYGQRLTIEQAAELSGYDTTYFCKQFKSITGMSFHRYLNRYRINVACQLLEDPALSVSTIAEQTGFSSSKSFCRSFKELTGMTATQYQSLRPEEKTISWQ